MRARNERTSATTGGQRVDAPAHRRAALRRGLKHSPLTAEPLCGSAILIVDNRDSFVFNIVQYLLELGAECIVRDRAEVTVADAHAVDGVLLSPGPGHPSDTGVCLDLVRAVADRGGPPLLGVCLGLQVIAVAHGAVVSRAPTLVHGYTSRIRHTGAGVLAGLPDPFAATRYHSLAVDPATVPDSLEVTARTEDAIIMGLRHRTRPIEGVQFHPESVLSEGGRKLLGNWLRRVCNTALC